MPCGTSPSICVYALVAAERPGQLARQFVVVGVGRWRLPICSSVTSQVSTSPVRSPLGDIDPQRTTRTTRDDRNRLEMCDKIGPEVARGHLRDNVNSVPPHYVIDLPIEREAPASRLLRAGLQPDRHLDALLVAHHGEPYRSADLIVVETTLQPRHAVDSLPVDGNDDVSGNNRAARFGP